MLSTPVIAYQGPLSFGTIDRLLSEFKLAAQEHDLSFRIYKKVLLLMIETLENITKYIDQVPLNGNDAKTFSPAIYINRSTDSIELVARNPVKKKDVGPLRNRIDAVNNHQGESLKRLYKEILTNGQFTHKGGAGLGFIEMAKATGKKLEYTFEELSADYDLYTFRVVMNL